MSRPTVVPRSAGAASLMVPGIGMEAGFLEEPAMLLAFVLLGRSLETRARAQAARDLQDLATLLPARAALVAGDGGDEEALLTAEVVDVPTSRVLEGDIVRVLPGERVPVDGQVLAGAAGAVAMMLSGLS